jgi:hypothetical protein
MNIPIPLPRIPPAVARQLGYYVYLYVNPIDDSVFYVGKGQNGRALAHLRADEKNRITKIIRNVRASGAEPRIDILAHRLGNPTAALKVEAAAIDLLELKTLANAIKGHGAQYGRKPLKEVVAHYTKRKADIREPAILIRINRLYRYGMTDAELYDATRSAWQVGRRRDDALYAFAVYEGVVREVYRITHWHPSGSTFNSRRGGLRGRESDRWEFVGTLAEDKIRYRYVNRYVGHLFTQGAQNPIAYVNLRRVAPNNKRQLTKATRTTKAGSSSRAPSQPQVKQPD